MPHPPNRSLSEFLVACAAPIEGRGLDDVAVLQLGVGKVAAAITMTAALHERRPAGVLLFGVAGAFPARHHKPARSSETASAVDLAPGSLCVIGSDRLGDEGVLTESGFESLSALGLGDTGALALPAELAAVAAERLGAPVVEAVTVSTCSANERSSEILAERTRAAVETMEGAAVLLACERYDVPLVHVRAISNWTGDRERGAWDLGLAVQRVQGAVRALRSVQF